MNPKFMQSMGNQKGYAEVGSLHLQYFKTFPLLSPSGAILLA